MKELTILILGGKGKTGRRVAERLVKLGHKNIRIAGRSETPAFDWENPETWPAVLEGMDSVYITFQPDLAIPSAAQTIREFATAANLHGIRKMVLLSGRGEKEAEICEKIIMEIAKEWTIVRASWFNQNFSEGFFLESILTGNVALPRAETLEPFIDADDIADVIVETLIDSKHNKKIYELTGPRLWNFPQVISEIASATGRRIQFQPLTLDENQTLLRQYQVPEDHIWLFNYLFTEVLDGRNASVTADVQKILAREAKDFTAYVKETAATGLWNPVEDLSAPECNEQIETSE